jgi:TrmH family RNA methyltransferase
MIFASSVKERPLNRERQAFDLKPPELLRNVVIVLVNPTVAGNIGSAARALKTMGLSRLVIVDGADYLNSAEGRKMAHRSWDTLESARQVATFEEAVTNAHYVVGTTHRHRGKHLPKITSAREAVSEIVARAANGPVALIFGTEDYGLTDEVLQKCNAVAAIPTALREPSLNLAQAVMLFCYEIFLASLDAPPAAQLEPASTGEMEQLYAHMLGTLQAIGFRPHHGRPESFKRALRRVFGRAPLEKQDVRLLHRIFQQIDYFVKRDA